MILIKCSYKVGKYTICHVKLINHSFRKPRKLLLTKVIISLSGFVWEGRLAASDGMRPHPPPQSRVMSQGPSSRELITAIASTRKSSRQINSIFPDHSPDSYQQPTHTANIILIGHREIRGFKYRRSKSN